MAASASPASTFSSTVLTSSSSDFGVTVTLALASTCLAKLPAGTAGAASTTEMSDRARSARVWMPLGLPGATAISRRLRVKVTGVSTRPAVTSFCMVVWSAVAMTSAGAPLMMLVTSCWEPANEKVAVNRGLAACSVGSASLNASVNDAAASTVSEPLSGTAVAAAAGVDGAALLPQPPSRPTASTARRRPLPRCTSGHRRQLDDHVGRLDRRHRQHAGDKSELVRSLPADQ